jgi:hypothetical protein
MKSRRARMQPVVAALVAGLAVCPSALNDVAVRLRSALHPDTFSADAERQPQARFCLIGGDDSCPGLQTFRACLTSFERCTYEKRMLLISSPGD